MHEFKEMIKDKLDDMARYYKGKEVKDITTTALEAMSKMVDMLKDISTIEGMDEYVEHEYEMSGARGRNTRTGRYISRGMGRDHIMDRRYMTSYDDGEEALRDNLEEIMRTTTSSAKREAARKLLKEMEGTD